MDGFEVSLIEGHELVILGGDVEKRCPLLHAAEHGELGSGLQLHRRPEVRHQLAILLNRDDTEPGT